MKRIVLAGSENYKLYFRYEQSTLEGEFLKNPLIVSEFYYPVECGCIDINEKWVITGGHGIIVYYLEPPFLPYEIGKVSTLWKTKWYPEKNHNWYPEAITQINDRTVRVLMDMAGTEAGIYDIDVYTLNYEKKL